MEPLPALTHTSAAAAIPPAAIATVLHRAEKAPLAYRTISEAAELLAVPQHVLRFWETKFPQLSPMKRSGGRRYYRPQDLQLLKTIQHLLHAQGYTIKGAQRLLKAKRGSADMPAMDGQALQLAQQAGAALESPDLLDTLVRGIGNAAAEVIEQVALEPALLELIPAHLPAKPAALMASGLEAGRPVVTAAPGYAAQNARLSALLDELAVLKAELR